MLDLRTLLILLAAADLILAAALWIGASQGMRDGLAQWAASLAVRALALAVFALDSAPGSGALAVAGALLALSMTLQAASLLAFERRAFPPWMHTAAIAAVAVPLQLVERDAAMAILFGGVMFGSLLLVVAAIARQVRSVAHSPSHAIWPSVSRATGNAAAWPRCSTTWSCYRVRCRDCSRGSPSCGSSSSCRV